jgi:FemAB-related protein (PEP-CTERM system-associated)
MLVGSHATQQEWDAYVTAHPGAEGYHLWRWREVFERAFGHRTEYLLARRGTEVAGVLPLVLFKSPLFGRFAVSLPFVNYGGVLASDDEAARALLDAASAVARRWRASHVELRHRSQRFHDLPAKTHKVAMLKPLPDTIDAAWQDLSGTIRNRVRKAEKSGLSAVLGGAELLEEFYPIFASNMRNLGTPVYAKRFFDEVCAAFPQHTRVAVVRHDARPVAACVTYTFRRTLQVPWIASLKEYRPMAPNNLLYWRVTQWAVETGCGTFDFGRSSPDDTVCEYKRRWGAVAEPLCWEYQLHSRQDVPDQGPRNPKFRLAIEGWKRLPLRVTTILGPPIVRGIP